MAPKVRKRHVPPDYYGLLGLPREATFREIEAAYWEQAKREENRDKIALLNDAYEVLGHTNRRAAYDAELAAARLVAEEPPTTKLPAHSNPDLASKLRWYLQ